MPRGMVAKQMGGAVLLAAVPFKTMGSSRVTCTGKVTEVLYKGMCLAS